MRFDIAGFSSEIISENSNTDVQLSTQLDGNCLKLFLQANDSKPMYVKLKWSFDSDPETLVLGDAWERSYGELEFRKLKNNDRAMPWYFIAANKESCLCFGVKTQPNSFVSFTYDESGIAALVDCRNGGSGVHLQGRKICLAEFVLKEYDNSDVFKSLCDYCQTLCSNPILPSGAVYGGNNWYYAYGTSSYEEILSDAKLQVALSKGISNKPFEVVDDCWQLNSCKGPWLANDKFKDMKALADDIKKAGARPGIWVRLLLNLDESITNDMKINRSGVSEFLDPTVPETQVQIKSDIERIKGWGYELLKHDFSTVDLFGDYGKDLTDRITVVDGWHFHDKTKTNAEIVLDFYRLIKDASGDMLIIGCNTVSHLCAGLVQINRTGDDTSGKEWSRTKKMGVNTLAFRLAQNNAFYLVDADCVGIIGQSILWDKNGQWLDLLSKSSTALFISCNKTITNEQRADIAAAYRVFNSPHTMKPVDLFNGKNPSVFEIDGKEIHYNW